MKKPTYTIDNLRFKIDNCLPQISAVKENKIELNALTHGNYPGKRLKPEQLSGLSSMGYMNVVGEQDWGIEPHRNEGIEICFQETGVNQLTVDDKKYTTSPNTLTITRPWQLHHVGDPNLGPGRLHWIILDVGVRRPNQNWQWPSWCILTEADKEELTQLLRGNEHPAWQANNEILSIFKRLQTYIIADNVDDYMSKIIINLNQLFIALLELLRTQNIVTEAHLTTKTRTVDLFLKEIKSNYKIASYEWTLELMAEHCGIGRSAFSNYCQQLANISPITFLNNCRLEHAAHLLKENQETSITDLTFELGFSSSQYFSRCFKKKFGVSPKIWRNQTI